MTGVCEDFLYDYQGPAAPGGRCAAILAPGNTRADRRAEGRGPLLGQRPGSCPGFRPDHVPDRQAGKDLGNLSAPRPGRCQARRQPPRGSGRQSCPRACGQDSAAGAGKTTGKPNRAAEAGACVPRGRAIAARGGHGRRARGRPRRGGNCVDPGRPSPVNTLSDDKHDDHSSRRCIGVELADLSGVWSWGAVGAATR